MITKQLKIDGMTCGHCVMAVRRALSSLEGVEVRDVKIGTASIEYDEKRISEETIRAAVEEEGYAVAE